MDGEKELLGMWLSESEGAKFWLMVFTELQNRGVQDCFIACVDGLQGLPEAIETVFPQTQVQLCIVHKVRNSLKYVPWKERRAVAADLRAIYGATTLAAAEQALERFADRWDSKDPAISPSWLADWDRLTVFFDYPPAIRRAVYTTNAIESLNYALRKVLKPTFKGSECPYRIFGPRALYTTRGRGLAHHRPADDGVGPPRAARSLGHLSIIGPGLLV